MPIPNGVWGLPHSNKVGTLAAMLHKKAVRRRRTPLHLFGGVFVERNGAKNVWGCPPGKIYEYRPNGACRMG